MSREARMCVYGKQFSFASTNVGTGAWVTLEAALGPNIRELEIFCDSAQVLELGYGPAGSEVHAFYIMPSGNAGYVKQLLNSGMRLAIRLVTGSTITTGNLVINGYQ